MAAIEINQDLAIPETELSFSYSRSSGPGGQNVNRVQTRVALHFDVVGSPTLSAAEKRRIADRLATRMSKRGVLRVISQRHRTQAANQEATIDRLVELLRDALKRRRPRRKSAVPRSAKRRRLEDKRRRADLKRTRSRPTD